MSGDYSRHRFDARNDYSSVWMQQGRVQLDADWNEWAQMLDRRARTAALDSIPASSVPGIAGVAMVSPQTPDAFRIEAAGGQLGIGRGRMVVDGLLAENHGSGADEFDPVLAAVRGAAPTPYTGQPYFHNPPPLPGGGTHLAYLETWQRELTWLQRPDLVEKALSVDTTTRQQTVWQVRVLANVGNVDCQTPDAQVNGWPALIRPSSARLSSRAVGVPPDLDPCELPPGGGYRGLENQLYRIEVHDGGPLGQATFKWSRDNASVGARVMEIVSGTTLKLESLGRDAVLRFNTGDWVEVVDDWWELSGENNDPALRRGVMRKITVDDASRTISFTPALPAGLIPGGGSAEDTLEARNLRVRRFDQKGTVRDAANNIVAQLDPIASNGVIDITPAGTWVTLENGVQVDFSLAAAGGEFKAGDYWVFTARSADASLEELQQAPPLGVHRHYTRLALVNFPETETDCRPQPATCGGCCTVNVSPGQSIQAALDSLPDEGGCVCLKTGVHDIPAPIEIRRSRIVLRGESPGAIVRGDGLQVMLQVGAQGALIGDIVVEGIRFESPAAGDGTLFVYLSDCMRVRIEHCQFVYTGDELAFHMGILADDVRDLTIRANRIQKVYRGIWVEDALARVTIDGNLVSGITYDLAAQGDIPLGEYGIRVDSDTGVRAVIENNRVRDFWTGVAVAGMAADSLVAHNRIIRGGSSVAEDPPGTTDAQRAWLDSRSYAIDIVSAGCAVRCNALDLNSNIWGGIRVRAPDCVVTGNLLRTGELELPFLAPAGIHCGVAEEQGRAGDGAQVHDNRLVGPQTGITAVRVHGISVRGNHVDGLGTGWFGVRLDACEASCAQANQVREVLFAIHAVDGANNRVADNILTGTALGITADSDSALVATGNTMHECVAGGMLILASGGARLDGNRVANCGYAVVPVGIAVFSQDVLTPTGAAVQIQNCSVVNTGLSALTGQAAQGPTYGILGWLSSVQITGNHVGYTGIEGLDTGAEHRALMLLGPIAYRSPQASAVIEFMTGSALITDNHLHGPSPTTLAQLMRLSLADNVDLRFEKVTFSDNVCEHLAGIASDGAATVALWGGHLIAMGNHVKADRGVFSMALGNRDRVALMGNVTTGDYLQVGTVKPTPINNFNVKI